MPRQLNSEERQAAAKTQADLFDGVVRGVAPETPVRPASGAIFMAIVEAGDADRRDGVRGLDRVACGICA